MYNLSDMKVSLIATVLNEGDSIKTLMDSICVQSRLPDEVIICDGGSTDHTLDLLKSYNDKLPLIIVDHPGANISEGRNTAIQRASHTIIGITDAGVRLDPHWLEYLVKPFETNQDTQVVAGFFSPDTQTPFEVAMGATVLPTIEDIQPDSFMPSSRSVALKKTAWEKVGGYPDWLDFCEDLVFDFQLAELFGQFEFAESAIVYFKPRTSLGSFFKQYYLYARGDGKANLFFRRHLIRYLTYLIVLPILVIASIQYHPAWSLLLVLGGMYMVWVPYRRLFRQWESLNVLKRLQAFFWVPLIRVWGDIAKMTGYPVGIVWRRKNQPPDWRLQHEK